MSYDEVRCRGERKHFVNGKEYDCCGALLLGIDTWRSCDVVVKCKICKRHWNITTDEDNVIVITEVDKMEFNRLGDSNVNQ